MGRGSILGEEQCGGGHQPNLEASPGMGKEGGKADGLDALFSGKSM